MLKTAYPTLILGLRDLPPQRDREIVRSLVQLAVALKLAVDSHPLEALDLQTHLSGVERMLAECMAADSMDDERNLAMVLQSRKNDEKMHFEATKLSQARSFNSGPLVLCVQHRLFSLLGTTEVRSILLANN